MSWRAHNNKVKLPRELEITCDCGYKYTKEFVATEAGPWEAELKHDICPECKEPRFPVSLIEEQVFKNNRKNLKKLREEGKSTAEIATLCGYKERTVRRKFNAMDKDLKK